MSLGARMEKGLEGNTRWAGGEGSLGTHSSWDSGSIWAPTSQMSQCQRGLELLGVFNVDVADVGKLQGMARVVFRADLAGLPI